MAETMTGAGGLIYKDRYCKMSFPLQPVEALFRKMRELVTVLAGPVEQHICKWLRAGYVPIESELESLYADEGYCQYMTLRDGLYHAPISPVRFCLLHSNI